MHVSIKQKIVGLILVLALVPTSLLGIYNYQNTNNILANEFKQSSAQSVTKVEESTDMFMKGFEQSIDRLAHDPNIINVLSETNGDKAVADFQTFKASHPDALNVYIGTQNKKFYVYPQANLPSNFDPTTRPWYSEAIKAKHTIWTDPYVDTATKKLTVTIAQPVYAKDTKELIGVMGIDISLDSLTKVIEGMTIGKQGYIVMTDNSGKIMVDPDKSQLGKPLSIPELTSAISNSKTGVVDFSDHGDKKFAAFAAFGKTGWKFIGIMSYAEISNATAQILKQTAIGTGVLAVIAILLGLFIANTFLKTLKFLVDEAKEIGEGDFTVRSKIKSKDEIGTLSQTLNQMVDNLGNLMVSVKQTTADLSASAQALAATSEETNAAAEEVTATVTQIAQGASDQAVQAEKGSQMVSRLAQKFEELNLNSGDMYIVSQEVVRANTSGKESVKGLTLKTEDNKTAIDKIQAVITELDNKAQSIGLILQTISSIAEQTNLLALNASIEAARAGEAGRGFAVVAEEIRKLAEQSSQSASGISEIILDIQKQSEHAVGVMKEVQNHTNAQISAVSEVHGAFEQISSAIIVITDRITQMTKFIEDMSQDGNSIVEVIQNISAVSEETAAASQEVTASMEQTAGAIEHVAGTADQLNILAEKLKQEVEKFKVAQKSEQPV